VGARGKGKRHVERREKADQRYAATRRCPGLKLRGVHGPTECLAAQHN
jgi:hypothetical protein